MWYAINGIPKEGLKSRIDKWKTDIDKELIEYPSLHDCPSYKEYIEIFGKEAPRLTDLDDEGIAELAQATKNKPQVIHRFLEKVVLPNRKVFPQKLGFNSMDLVSMFHKFGGYSGTVQTRSTFQTGVSNKDDINVDIKAGPNFDPIYNNPANQTQYRLPNLDSAEFASESLGQAAIPSLSKQLQAGGINLKEFRAIIDVGGLFKELDYGDMARDILEKFSPNELQAVLVYNDKSELMILRRGSEELEPFDPRTVPPEPSQRFTIYRQPQCTGSDIPQYFRAKALVTINEKTGWGDFEQGVGRLRGNKKGQTFAVVYRESLLEKIENDIRIARANHQDDETEELSKLIVPVSGNTKIEVRNLTFRSEQAELKQRRFFSALSEMENIFKSQILQQLCRDKSWKELFKIFESTFFEDSLKNADQLLAIKKANDPTDMLKDYNKKLLAKIEEALSQNIDDLTKAALNNAKIDLQMFNLSDEKRSRMIEQIDQVLSGRTSEPLERMQLELYKSKLERYKYPSKNQMPESVLGTSNDSTKEVEVSHEVEKEKVTELERVVLEETESSAGGVLLPNWIEWEPANITGVLKDNERLLSKGDIIEPIIYSLDSEAPRLLNHLTSKNAPLKVDYENLFAGISVSTNILQHRLFGGSSLLSNNQKICRSLAEISMIEDGKRVYKHILLDIKDHGKFDVAMRRANSLMTPQFMSAFNHIIADRPDGTTIRAVLSDETVINQLFTDPETRKDDAEFLIGFIGENYAAKNLGTLSLRLNVDGKYTTSLGALDTQYSDDQTKEQITRAKIIRGETSFSPEEREILIKVINEDYLQVVDFEKLIVKLQAKHVSDVEIAEILASKRSKNIRDLADLTIEEREQTREKLGDFLKLYGRAVRMHFTAKNLDIQNTHIGLLTRDLMVKLTPQKAVTTGS